MKRNKPTRGVVEIDAESLNKALEVNGGIRVLGLHPGRHSTPPMLTIEREGVLMDIPLHRLTTSKEAAKPLLGTEAEHEPKVQAASETQDPTIAYLQDNQLPLYWNREWLASQLQQHGTYAEVARKCESQVLGVSPTTLANYARKAFGWQVRAATSRKRDSVLAKYQRHFQSGVTQPQLADEHGVSVSTVHRWLTEGREAYEKARANRVQLQGNAHHLAEFAVQHNLQVETVRPWLEAPSEAFEDDGATQPKRHYYSRREYAEKKERVQKAYEQAGRKLNRGRLAEELGVDPTTITSWLQALERERNDR